MMTINRIGLLALACAAAGVGAFKLTARFIDRRLEAFIAAGRAAS